MPSAALALPGRLAALTGGSIYDRHIADGLRARGWTLQVLELSTSFPEPSPAELDDANRALETIADGTPVIVDGLAFGAMPDVAERHAARLRLVALVHLPLAEAIGLNAEAARRHEVDERRSLAAAKMVIATGRSTVEAVVRYGATRDRVVLVEPGTDRSPLARGSRDDCVHILCVASITPGKGHDVLLMALAGLRHLNWKLTCVGSLSRHPATAATAAELVRREALEDRVTMAGELAGEALEACFAGADLFALATARETYGMAVAEAVAHGLPVVATATGAIPEILGGEAGLVVEPGDMAAFGAALTHLLTDDDLRRRLRAGALHARERLPGWDDAVTRIAAAIERLAADD